LNDTPRQDGQLKKRQPSQPFCPPSGRLRASFAVQITVAALVAAITMPSALAEPVPVPKPAPKARTVIDAQRPAPQNPIAGGPTAAAPPTPILPDLRSLFGAIGGATPTFDANQKAWASKVSTYLSSLVNVSGNFVQVGPDGKRTTGDFYIQKPGKIRFEYDDPSPIALVADGSSVIVRDRRLATQDVYPLSQTPLRYLLAERIDLLRDTNVVGVAADDMFISVTIEEKQALVGTSRLMLMIGAKDNQLKQWTVTDPQGYDTTVAVYNLDTTRKLDPGMFKIDYTNYSSPNN